ncbi:hypothetical protein TNIN_131401 [Trichonephila inaurata madagascariensis]|uniref:Uncharacterized protein n=1 Tax=Trichonephila inaurata madagascariensis TaxID=2747483 RepID=A0A8X7CL07_9ARAC|nr:hypothetical protein TNIN_131401 [Trichonephila inaurata madagascariensis]
MSVQACNQENSASLSMSIEVKLDDSKVNIQDSPSLCSIQKIAPKSTGAEKGCNKSKECRKSYNKSIEGRKSNDKRKERRKSYNKSIEGRKRNDKSKECRKSNNTVVEKSTTKHKLNHGHFKQIKRPDIDKHSMQKPLQRSYDESKSGSAVPHSSPFLRFITTQSTKIKDSTECVQVAQSNAGRVGSLKAKLKDPCNRGFKNAFKKCGILRRNLKSNITVKDCFSRPDVNRVLSKLFFRDENHFESRHDNGIFESFLNCSLRLLIQKYIKDTIRYIFPNYKDLNTKRISTNKILNYANGRCKANEVFYVTQFFRRDKFLNLENVIRKYTCVGILLSYDIFKKGNKI